MDSILHSVIHFVFAIGLLVSFHEYGHFWVARKAGVKVLRFSIGFGKVIWSYQKNSQSTEYVVSAIPLGGYVKMLDEREGPVAEDELHLAFNRKPLLSRALIVAAGPMFNFLLAVLLFWAVFMIGETGVRPILGEVAEDTIAWQGGFVEGDEILTINGKKTPTWTEALAVILSHAVAGDGDINVEIKNASGFAELKQLKIKAEDAEDPEKLFGRLGLVAFVPKLEAVIERVIEGEAADLAGLQTGDRLLEADGETISSWMQWVEYVRAHPLQEIAILVDRGGVHLNLQITPTTIKVEQGEEVGRIGASVVIPEELVASMRVEYSLPPLEALEAAIKRTYLFASSTVKVMGSMLIGKASVDNLSGPISIAQFAGQSANIGMVAFLKFIASVSVGLAVVNLLPIPVLDGGHLLFYAIEALKGSPVSEEAQILFQNIGMFLLLMLMGFAVILDLGRVFG